MLTKFRNYSTHDLQVLSDFPLPQATLSASHALSVLGECIAWGGNLNQRAALRVGFRTDPAATLPAALLTTTLVELRFARFVDFSEILADVCSNVVPHRPDVRRDNAIGRDATAFDTLEPLLALALVLAVLPGPAGFFTNRLQNEVGFRLGYRSIYYFF